MTAPQIREASTCIGVTVPVWGSKIVHWWGFGDRVSLPIVRAAGSGRAGTRGSGRPLPPRTVVRPRRR